MVRSEKEVREMLDWFDDIRHVGQHDLISVLAEKCLQWVVCEQAPPEKFVEWLKEQKKGAE